MQHASIGQEAIAIGAVYGLRTDDLVMPSLRDRGVFLAKGVPLHVQIAGVYGKATGAGGGKSTAHHMGDPSRHVLLGSGVVGASIAVAVGAALGIKLEHSERVVLDFFGDGAAQRGDFHEGLNLAGVFKLPIIFICENNGYAEYTPVSAHMAGESFAIRARGYGFPGEIIDGCDVIAVYDAVQAAVQRARAGFGPTLLEARTHRWRSHCERERPESFRVPGEMEQFEARDPIRRLREQLRLRGVLTRSYEREIEDKVATEIDGALKYAKESPYPGIEELTTDVYEH
jgi:TPP-dependent pyruvate/acetoin dehydrogenase alpha subunit